MAAVLVYEGPDPLNDYETAQVIVCVDTDPQVALGAHLVTIGRYDMMRALKLVRRRKVTNSFRGIVSSSVCPESELPQ